MAITMQGKWTVDVKSKAAAFQQRFIINGSANGVDGIYTEASPPVDVSGSQWTIQIQHKRSGRGSSWQPSDMRLGTPAASGSQTTVDILSNDSGGDADYNDLVLTCTSSGSYVLYGKVRSYKGLCFYNPCFPYVVIDTFAQLAEAVKYKPFRDIIGDMYPERLRLVARSESDLNPQPYPPFPPIVIPTNPTTPRRAVSSDFSTQLRREIGSNFRELIDTRLIDIAKIRDRFKYVCSVKNQPGLLLRFMEYDRTAAELAGGAYTGDGDREHLGYTATDEVGNYVFSFTRNVFDFLDELGDVAAGGPGLPEEFGPDIVVQVVDGLGGGSNVLFETAPHMNVGKLQKINLCIPEGALNPAPATCQGGRAIQSIGNISTLSTLNSFDSVGRVTATDPNAPLITRGGWNGALHVYGCFSDKPEVSHFTVRFDNGEGLAYVNEEYKYINIAHLGDSNNPAHIVGPWTGTLNGTTTEVPIYKNLDTDRDGDIWENAHRFRKIVLHTAKYAPATGAGSVTFEIQGYKLNGAGKLVAVSGAQDEITLFIDHTVVKADIDSIVMGATPPNDCALFDISTPNEPLTMRFRVNQESGLLQQYWIKVTRGANKSVPVYDGTPPAQPLNVSYDVTTHGNVFFGTLNAVSPDGDCYVEADLQPVDGRWLPVGQPFCAFAFELFARVRTTNGYSNAGNKRYDMHLVGISEEV